MTWRLRLVHRFLRPLTRSDSLLVPGAHVGTAPGPRAVLGSQRLAIAGALNFSNTFNQSLRQAGAESTSIPIRACLCLLLCCRVISAQPSFPVAIPESSTGPNLAEQLHDSWPGVATATNSWAAAIRQQQSWDEVHKASVQEAQKLAQSGVSVAQLRVGYCYFAGDGLSRDYAEATSWLRKAADAHLAPAQFLLGIAYLNGLGVEQNFATAVDRLSEAAEQGFADAEFQLALCFLRGGPGVNQAPARGIKWLTRAAEQGKPNAQQFLAWCYASGTGINEDPAEAIAWCRRAADQDLVTAQDFLGMFCASGYGTNQDWPQAVAWFRKAAERGLPTAQIHLAQCYANGRGVDKSPAQAWLWWRAAADQGYPSAQFHAGLCRYLGSGTPQDYPAAADWFLKAAQQHHVGGQLYLGLCYFKGLGVTTDTEEAQKWWREAAVHGIAVHPPELGDGEMDVEKWWQDVAEQATPRLQCCLAEFYRFGQGVPQSDAKALKWYSKAAAAGDLSGLEASAWLLSTSPNANLRDGQTAIDLAKKAAALSKRKDPRILDILAAAYAETTNFSKAISAEKDAIALAQEEDQKKEYQSRLKLYQARSPFRVLENTFQQPQTE